MRWLAFLLLIWPACAAAQTLEVRPDQLALSVEVEDRGVVPMVREMVLITVRGTYRRHITRETLVQPDLEGFSWAQLGPDIWTEDRINGRPVKVFTRHMALYPDKPGRLTIGPFTHRLTLTDEGDDWFDHEIRSAPVTITVDPAPESSDWWFPVRSLKISDQWSNAPDQLQSGEGVLRIIRLDALGVTPEMIPPMPELTSPSAMIFAHPEKRLVELTPDGPLTHAFWRWTIRPGNDLSAIVEPLELSYYDTTTRQARSATISAQRVAYGDRTPEAGTAESAGAGPIPEGRLPGAAAVLAGLSVLLAGVLAGTVTRRWTGLRRIALIDPQRWRLRAAARAGDARAVRRHAARMMADGEADPSRAALLSRLDSALFGTSDARPDLRRFVRDFLALPAAQRPPSEVPDFRQPSATDHGKIF